MQGIQWKTPVCIQINVPMSWNKIFAKIDDQEWEFVDSQLNREAKYGIVPLQKNIFGAFNMTPFDNIKVVFLGQDPYHNTLVCDKDNKQEIPQATGLSFSVPSNFPIPSSLKNIIKNLIKYSHISDIPKNGDLTNWAKQGCLMLNTALTVRKNTPGSHNQIWSWFTDFIIEMISSKLNNIVFVCWGAHAQSKIKFINEKKHKIICSSHPSGLSFNKKMKNCPAFVELDHFGEINKYLEENNIKKINWHLDK